MEHGIAGRKCRHKASSPGAAASVALLLPLDAGAFDEAGRYATGTVEGRRLAFEVISGHLVAAR